MNTQLFTNNESKESHYAFGDLLSSQDREYLVENSHLKTFNKGDVLCRQNRIEDVLYVILMGEVEVIEETADADGTPIGKLYTGDLVGEIAALFTVPRIASVYATKSTVVLEIPASAFSGLLKKTPLLGKVVYQKLYERSLETALRCAGKPHSEQQQKIDLTRIMSCWQSKEQH